MYKNGDKVYVNDLLDSGDCVECIVVGIGDMDLLNKTIYAYIVRPIEQRGDWEVYVVGKSRISVDKPI